MESTTTTTTSTTGVIDVKNLTSWQNDFSVQINGNEQTSMATIENQQLQSKQSKSSKQGNKMMI